MPIPFVSEPHTVPIVVLYIGPDQIMPLTSVLGAAFGLALMFWNRLVILTRRSWAFFSSRGRAGTSNLLQRPDSTAATAHPKAE